MKRVLLVGGLMFLAPFISSAATCVNISKTLSLNSKTPEVSVLQKFLRDNAGYTGSISGNLGPGSVNALTKWQIQTGIIRTSAAEGAGKTGPKTRAALACNKANVPAATSTKSPDTQSLTEKVAQLQAALSALQGTGSVAKVSTQATVSIKPSNLYSGADPKKIRMAFEVSGTSFQRGQRIPVKVTILDPVPYTGADLEFMQSNSENGLNTFGAQVHLPVGFSGEISHFLNASHVDIEAKDASTGMSPINIRAFVEAPFRDSDYGGDVTRTFGQSNWKTLKVSEDQSVGRLTFSANGVDATNDPKTFEKYLRAEFRPRRDWNIVPYFAATTTSRATAIESCGSLSGMLETGVNYSCNWNGEDLVPQIREKVKTVPASTVTLSSRTGLGSYFLYKDGIIIITNTAITRAEALQNCIANHTGNPSTSMHCAWNNDVIYDKGPIGTRVGPSDVEPGPSPGGYTTP